MKTNTQSQSERVVGGRYRLLTQIGKGGMSVVWLAMDTTLGKHCLLYTSDAADEL